MTTWTTMLDSLEENLDRMQTALETGAWDDLEMVTITDWATAAPTPDELGRYEALSERAGRLEVEVRTAMAAIQEEIGGGEQVRRATRSYVTADHIR